MSVFVVSVCDFIAVVSVVLFCCCLYLFCFVSLSVFILFCFCCVYFVLFLLSAILVPVPSVVVRFGGICA